MWSRELQRGLVRIRADHDAALAVFLPLTQSLDGAHYYGEGCFAGDDARRDQVRRNTAGQQLTTSWQPANPEPGDVNRFALCIQRLRSRGESAVLATARGTFYRDLGAFDTMRMLVYDGARCIGWVGVLQHEDAADFCHRDLQRTRSEQSSWTAQLVAEYRSTQAHLKDGPAHIVCREDGSVLSVSANVGRWLGRETRRRVGEVAREVVRHGASVHAIGRYAWQGALLRGDDGMRVYLNAPLGSFGSLRLGVLSPRQRECADLAALGMRVREIAEELRVSPHTAKQHLAAAYRLLDVRRREDLVAALQRG